MKVSVKCSWCGLEILRYPSQLKVSKNSYCSSECRSNHISKKTNPEGYTRHEHLSKYNITMNQYRMTDEVKEKISKARFGTGAGKGYLKLKGRHVHRVVAEEKLGRKLRPGEVVHHIDHNKRNNAPENLMVFKSQKDHVKFHAREKQGGDAV